MLEDATVRALCDHVVSIEISQEPDCVVLRQTAYIDKLMGTYAPDGVPVEPWGAEYPLGQFTKSKKPLPPADSDLCDATNTKASNSTRTFAVV